MSSKGGSGTSVVAALIALALAEHGETVLIDAAGDQHAIFDMPRADVGFRQWMEHCSSAPTDALVRLVRRVNPTLGLISAGSSDSTTEMGVDAVKLIRESFPDRSIVVDAGVVSDQDNALASLVEQSDVSMAVIRNCYLAARRALDSRIRCDGIIVIEEPARALSASDISAAIDKPLLAALKWDASVARVVDAGRLKKLPRSARVIGSLVTKEWQRAS